MSVSADTPLNMTPIDGGYRVRLSADGQHHIDVMRMLYNWRIVTTPVSCTLVWDRGWCYFGTTHQSFIKAVMAALVWDGNEETEPPGYDKAL